MTTINQNYFQFKFTKWKPFSQEISSVGYHLKNIRQKLEQKYVSIVNQHFGFIKWIRYVDDTLPITEVKKTKEKMIEVMNNQHLKIIYAIEEEIN